MIGVDHNGMIGTRSPYSVSMTNLNEGVIQLYLQCKRIKRNSLELYLVSHVKFLAVYLQENFSWNEHCSNLTKKSY